MIEFTVQQDHYGRQRWLTPRRTWTHDEEEALVLRLQRSPKMRDVPAIEAACTEIAGGARVWLDLTVTARELWADRNEAWARALWPEGRPAAISDEDEQDQERQIWGQYAADTSNLGLALRMVRQQVERIRFLAGYRFLVVDPPAGWASVLDMPDEPTGLVDLLMEAHAGALNEAATATGK